MGFMPLMAFFFVFLGVDGYDWSGLIVVISAE
jgi:hypothetical protein